MIFTLVKDKISKYGLLGFVKKLLMLYIDKSLCYFFKLVLPIDNRLIVFESSGDFSDNSYALYDYLKNAGILGNYKVAWLVKDVTKAQSYHNQIIVLDRDLTSHSFKRCRCLATAHFYIYDHSNYLEGFKREGQVVVNLWHGIPMKASKGIKIIKKKDCIDYAISTSKLSSEFLSQFCNVPLEKYLVTGYPRNDYFFHDRIAQKERIKPFVDIDNYNKVIVWMPTFRQSVQQDLSENYSFNETGLPIFAKSSDIENLDNYLCKNNILVVLKIHYLQSNLPVFNKKFKNIIILKDADLTNFGFQLYQFIAVTDALITDYSSIGYDYMLLDKPIVFTIDDFEDYKKSRGFVCENITDYLSGYKVKTVDTFVEALNDIIQGNDAYKEKRHQTCSIIHDYQDGNSSKRIAEYLKL